MAMRENYSEREDGKTRVPMALEFQKDGEGWGRPVPMVKKQLPIIFS